MREETPSLAAVVARAEQGPCWLWSWLGGDRAVWGALRAVRAERGCLAGVGHAWGAKRCLTSSPVRASQFLQFRTKIMNKQLDRFGNRVEFTGNPTKYDVSFTLKNVQLEDEGTYNCYVLNPPDRQRGHASINLKVLTQGQWQSRPLCRQTPMGVAPRPAFPLLRSRRVCSRRWEQALPVPCCSPGCPSWGPPALSPCPVSPEPPKHDSTVALIVGTSVGGFLALVILVLVAVKCVRRKKQQRLNTDDQKTEEEGKTDGEGNPDEGTK